MKTFPMQKDFSNDRLRDMPNPPLPWEVAKAVYDFMYAPLHGTSQSLERLAERGGFSYEEIRVLAGDLQRREKRMAASSPPAPPEPAPKKCDRDIDPGNHEDCVVCP